MPRCLLWSGLVVVMLCSFSIPNARPEAPIHVIQRVFKSYIKHSESTDSKDNKAAMEQALTSIHACSRPSDLLLLIDVWMYYDPTDFPTRALINPILENNRTVAITAIEKRLKRKKKWESDDSAPYSDLLALRTQMNENATR